MYNQAALDIFRLFTGLLIVCKALVNHPRIYRSWFMGAISLGMGTAGDGASS